MKTKLFKSLLFFWALLLCAFTQAQTVSGNVSDVDGPLIGANVIVKGTNNGVTTDFDGNYTINEVASDAILTISYVGYITQEISVNGQSTINVTLEEDRSQLQEVVVTGYVTQTRGDITGSVSSVNMDEAVKVPVVNAAEALQGRVTGVTVVNSARPGATPKITIRGFGTTNDTNPLYIIDGVQTQDASIFNSINPADIDQMNVLKDAAASIYGARASNGVVIVTTKSGGYNMDKAKISVDFYTGSSNATNLPSLLNAQQHGEMIFESLRNDGAVVTHPQYGSGASPVVPTVLDVREPATVKRPNGTYWPDEITRNAPTTNLSLSMQNGNETGKYFMSVNYLTRDGIINQTGFKRGSTRLNSEFKVLKDKVRIGEHLNVSFSNTRAGVAEAIQNSVRSSPLIPVYDDNGNFAGTYSNSAGLGNARSPVAQLYRSRDDFNKMFRTFGDIYLEADIIDGLTFKTTLAGGMESFNSRSFNALDPEHGEPISTNTLTETDFINYGWTWSNTLNYKKSFGSHNINALVGIEAVEESGKGKGLSRTGFLFETPDFYLLENGSGTPNVIYAYQFTNTLWSVFGTANYNYDGKYFATLTVRRDQSSRFKGDNQSDVFPSFSAGWLLSKEDFYPQDALINRIKIKASYGELGNQTLPGENLTANVSALSESLANYSFNGTSIATGALLASVGNPDLRWETSVSTNFGVDFGLLDNKLNLGFEYFVIKTEDLIAPDNSLISTTAIDAAAPLVNLGDVENKGVDLSLGYSDETDSGWSYGINVNVSSYKNEVTNLISEFQVGATGFRGGAITRTEVGRPISSFYGRIVEGIDSNGRFTYKDVNGDGNINDEDRDYIGSPHPDFTYGINLTTAYKGFDASAFFTGSQGNDIYNYQKIYSDFPTFFNANRSTRVLNSWTPSNTNASLPALSQTITNSETNPNTHFVEDGSYFRLKSLQVGYTFDDDIADKIGMDSFRIYLQGT
ncbi:MAG: TonB-dependent receptor, partial [Flavobacteriaceae bacterium]|nr:TonB-dependent receptor [Flavobacteriaceae bacterium]